MDKVYLLWRVDYLDGNDELVGVFANYHEADAMKEIFNRRQPCYIEEVELGDLLV